jgi:hypothetical protein
MKKAFSPQVRSEDSSVTKGKGLLTTVMKSCVGLDIPADLLKGECPPGHGSYTP